MGGGGDGGFTERQNRIDADKASARARLNAQFGIGQPSAAVIDPAAYTTPAERGRDFDGNPLPDVGGGGFDQAGYDAAVAAAKKGETDVAANKAALDALYANTRADAFNAGKRRIDEQKQTAGRNLKFELFARGLNGGSADVDQNALLGRTYTQGITDLGAKADSTATQLRGDNEQARLGLLQSIDNGMDSESALSSALGQMRVNSDRAAADATGTALGDLFANTGLIYQQNRQALGKQNAASAASSLFAQQPNYSSRGTRGMLTPTGG